MTALARNTPRASKGELITRRYPVNAASIIYYGSLVMIDADGMARPAAALAGNLGCVGLCVEPADNTGGADGAKTVLVQCGVFRFPVTSMTAAKIGTKLYASTDNDLSDTQGSNEPLAGTTEQYISATEAWVKIGPISFTKSLEDNT